MTVKDIIKASATLIGRDEIVNQLSGEQTCVEAQRSVDKMVELLNLVIGELSSSYVPLVKSETICTTDGRVYYDNLLESAVKIRKVFSAKNTELYFDIRSAYLQTDSGTVTVEYEFVPKKYVLTDTIDYTEKDVPMHALVYGLCAEFCLSEARFDQAITHHKRYVDAISQVVKLKSVNIKERGWY
jgi:hypothetical protein